MAKSDIQITMGLDFAAMQKSLAAIESGVKKSMAVVKTAVLATAATLGVGFGVKGFAGGIGGAIAYGKELDNVSRLTQMAVKDVVIMQHALDRTGVSATEAGEMMATLRDNISTLGPDFNDVNMALAGMGVSLAEVRKMSGPEQFEKLANAVNKIQNPLQRAKVSALLFGASAAQAVANFQKGDLAQSVRLFGRNAELMAKSAGTMAFISDAWNRIKGAGTEFFAALTTKIAPLIKPLLDSLEEVMPKVIEAGEKFGRFISDSVKVLVEAFKEGRLMELVSTSLSAAFRVAGDFLLSSLIAAVEGAAAFAGPVIKQLFDVQSLGGALLAAFKFALAGFESGFMRVLSTVTTYFSAAVSTAFDKIYEASPKFLKDPSGWNWKGPGFAARLEQAQKTDIFGSSIKYFDSKAMEAITEAADSWKNVDFKGPAAAAVDTFRSVFTEIQNLQILGSDKAMAKSKELIAELLKNFVTPPGKPIGKKPGDKDLGGKPFGTVVNTQFDELRRIGGGIGGNVQNIQQSQLDQLKEIAKNTAAALTGKKSTFGTNVLPAFGLPGVGMAGGR